MAKKGKGRRGDKPGHPFRGNQYTKRGSGTLRAAVTGGAKNVSLLSSAGQAVHQALGRIRGLPKSLGGGGTVDG
jgi:hypothetical protein